MAIIRVILVLLLVMAGITLFVLLSEPSPNASGMVHPTIDGMKVGGDGAERLAPIGTAPYWFQFVFILLVGMMLYLGVSERNRTLFAKIGLLAFVILAEFVWYMTYETYLDFLVTGDPQIAFGYPIASNWSLWGIWLSFVAFSVFYSLGFRRFIFTNADQKAFEDLVKETKSTQAENITKNTPETTGA